MLSRDSALWKHTNRLLAHRSQNQGFEKQRFPRQMRILHAGQHTLANTMKNRSFSNIALLAAGAVLMLASCGDDPCKSCDLALVPICAENGQTYSNPCEAECLGLSYVVGACPVWSDAWVRDQGSPSLDGCGFLLEMEGVLFHPRGMDTTLFVADLPVRVEFQETTHLYQCGLAAQTYPVVDVLYAELR